MIAKPLPIWLVVWVAGLPMLSETVYTPSLPDIAHDLNASVVNVEFTLTIYIIAFALGVLLWGILSDKIGRRPCLITGLIIYVLGCSVCYSANTIETLIIGRFIQGLGGSTGSVIGQAMCRDFFSRQEMAKVFTSVAIALCVFTSLGPAIGGLIVQFTNWDMNFVFLMILGSFITLLALYFAPETHPNPGENSTQLYKVFVRFITDPFVLGMGILVGGANGIMFSYYAEAPFIFVKLLHISPSVYGYTFFITSACSVIALLYSKKIMHRFTPLMIIVFAIKCLCAVTLLFALYSGFMVNFFSPAMTAIVIVACMAISAATIALITSNALSQALIKYKTVNGTASSFLGFFYYVVSAACTLAMSLLHNGTLLRMPVLFCIIAGSLYVTYKKFIENYIV